MMGLHGLGVGDNSGCVIKRRVICENGSHSYIGDVTCGEKKLRLV